MALHFPPSKTRVLGCLLEKERITPENYPISLHSLTAACNQSTNRDPVTGYDEKTVEQALDDLRAKKPATMARLAGSRVEKYRHNLLDFYNLDRGETALLCVLMLRGRQTPGELRARTERMHAFASTEAVEAGLGKLMEGAEPLVAHPPAKPGTKGEGAMCSFFPANRRRKSPRRFRKPPKLPGTLRFSLHRRAGQRILRAQSRL